MNQLIDNLARKLKAEKIFMCTAESCTGGLIAAACTSRDGSSEWFKGGIVSYSNEIKIHILGVSETTLAENGAVSLQVVEEMAAGALEACKAQASIAVSGVAGPGGGSPEKPVGTVCIGVAVQKSPGSCITVNSKRFLFDGARDAVREQGVLHGIMALKNLLE